ncbi:MAG: hypothetical protein K6E91_11965 [Butyrivibrio sp.]|nr:hypothetical protein [Butyrivibrio sp.]
MDTTRITPDNINAFEDLMPVKYKEQEDLLWFGAVTDDKKAVGCIALQNLGQNISCSKSSDLKKDVLSDPELMEALSDYGVRIDSFLKSDI